jgi:hypothetical protein
MVSEEHCIERIRSVQQIAIILTEGLELPIQGIQVSWHATSTPGRKITRKGTYPKRRARHALPDPSDDFDQCQVKLSTTDHSKSPMLLNAVCLLDSFMVPSQSTHIHNSCIPCL